MASAIFSVSLFEMRFKSWEAQPWETKSSASSLNSSKRIFGKLLQPISERGPG